MKVLIKVIFLFPLLWIFACSIKKPVDTLNNTDLNEIVGKEVTLWGKPANMKLGAVLILDNGQTVWMENLESWPNGYFVIDSNESNLSKTVKVTGILIEKNDLPVFIPSENDSLVQQGIPMPQGIDLKKASHRFLLKNYKFKEVE